MAKLWIQEYQFMGANNYAGAPIPKDPPLASQVVDFTSGEEQSAAFNEATSYIVIWSDTDCCILTGANPTATTSNRPVTAKVESSTGVTPGQKLSVIALA